MSTLHFSLMAFQVQSSGSVDRETLLVIFVGIIAFFFLALIAGLGAAVIYALKLKRDLLKSIDSVKATVAEKARPIVSSSNEFIREMTPKVKAITDDVVEISHTVRAQVTDLDSTLSDVTAKARAQADRVNGMVSSTLERTATVATAVEKNVKMPFREVAGLVAGVKAGWDVLTRPSSPSAKSDVTRAAQHVQSWEDEIAVDAQKAASVNAAPATPRYDRADMPQPPETVPTPGSVDGRRSMVEAGDEVAASAVSAKAVATNVSGSTQAAVEELRRRSTT